MAAAAAPQKSPEKMPAMERKEDVQPSERLIVIVACFAVAIVIAYELVKASQHATLANPLKSFDERLTEFWFLDIAVASLVTFALVWVALWFRRMERLLDHYKEDFEHRINEVLGKFRDDSGQILARFEKTAVDIRNMHGDLKNLQIEIESVSASISAKSALLQALDTPIMQQAYQATPFLQSNILASLRVQTEAWRDLIQDEFTNRHSVVGSINYGVRCWKVAIPTYLAEEASDIKTHTVATNIGLYLKLIEALVAEVLDSVKGTSTTVHLFASANILPVEYFNWRDDFNKAEKKRGMIGISRPFMDEYRKNIKAWVRLPNALMTRVFLVNSLPLTPPQREEAFPRMSIQDFATLQEQGELKILCQATDGQPKKMRVSQIMEYTQDVPQWLLTEQSQKDAYAIAKYFRKSDDELAKANLALRSLIEVVVEELHSRSPQGAPVNEYARYFEISDDERLKHLENLPKIPTRLGYIKSPDFLAIRLADGGASRTIACIAAQLNPDFETMSLSLITEKVALEGVDKFIGYATRESQPLSTLPR